MNKSRKKVRVVQLPTWMGDAFEELTRCKGSNKKEQLVQAMAHEAFVHSLTPSEDLGFNPYSPSIPAWFFSQFNEFQSAFSHLDEGTQRMMRMRMRSVISNLTNLWLELKMGYSSSSFQIKKGATKEEIQQVYLRQYERYFVAATLTSILESIFALSASDIKKQMRGFENRPLKQLNDQKTRVRFVKAVRAGLEKTVSLLKNSVANL